VEEKYGSASSKRRKTDNDSDVSSANDDNSDDDDSSDEDEDETGELVTEDLDAQIQATLAAIRSKDPKVYDAKTSFFTPLEEEAMAKEAEEKKEKGMTLKQYHQKNLLEGYTGEEEDDSVPQTYAQEQESLKRNVVKEMHEAVAESEDEDFLIKKPSAIIDKDDLPITKPAPVLPANAEADPEAFLDTFLNTKAWLPKDANGNVIFDSDDSEEEAEAEDFEHAYNMRFEDPTLASRSKIISHARDVTNKMSLRREEKSKRRKVRDERQERKQREQEEREADRNRLRNLQIEEIERKMRLVKEAGGLEGSDDEELDEGVEESEKKRRKIDRQWQKFLEHDWAGDEYEENMGKMFGDEYYKKTEDAKKVKKPTWDDDIDIKDLVPDFKEVEAEVELSDVEDDIGGDDDNEDGDEEMQDANDNDVQESSQPSKHDKLSSKPQKPSKQTSRILRANIESYVDDKLPLNLPSGTSKTPTTFRYRAVSPESYSLTPADILFAADKQLNEYAGLKKLASFRDESKKTKDKKRYAKGKGFKLREWRKEVFGKPEVTWEELVRKAEGKDVKKEDGDNKKKKRKAEGEQDGDAGDKSKKPDEGGVIDGERKKKIRKRRKAKGTASEE